jgi:hypothetical protein
MAFLNVLSRYLTGETEEEEGRLGYDIQACGRNLNKGNCEYKKKGSMESWLWHYIVVRGQSPSGSLLDPDSQLNGPNCRSEYEAKIVPGLNQ